MDLQIHKYTNDFKVKLLITNGLGPREFDKMKGDYETFRDSPPPDPVTSIQSLI